MKTISAILATEEVPSFDWLDDEVSQFGVPILKIRFPDGGPDDFAELKVWLRFTFWVLLFAFCVVGFEIAIEKLNFETKIGAALIFSI